MHELIYSIFHRHHFWRHIRMSELSELYVSLSLRVLGLSLIGIFIPVYFYQQGISITAIALFFVFYHLLRLFVDPVAAKLTAKYGPKHIIRFSYVIEIFYLVSVIGVGNGYAPLWLASVMNAFAFSFFFVPFQIDFSTIKNAKKVGSQMGLMYVVQQTAGALGPLAGGLLATFYSFELTLFVALFVTLLAGTPLLLSGEPGTKKTYRYKFKLSDYRHTVGENSLTYFGHGLNIIVNNLFWPLFAAVSIFSSSAYAGVGLVKAVGLGSAILAAHAIGKIVDDRKGRTLLRYATVLNALGHAVKPLVNTAVGAVSVSLVTEPVFTGMEIPFSKGHYDRVDSSKVGRSAYIVVGLAVLHFGRIFGWSFLALASIYFNEIDALALSIFIMGLATFLVLTERFKALD